MRHGAIETAKADPVVLAEIWKVTPARVATLFTLARISAGDTTKRTMTATITTATPSGVLLLEEALRKRPPSPHGAMKMPALSKSELKENNVIVGDCLKVLQAVPDGAAHAIITDPPFNIGLKYKDYNDDKTPAEFRAMLTEFAAQSYRVLEPTGSIWLFMGQAYQADAHRILRRAGFHWRNSIVWHYTFGQCQRRKFTPSWTMIHYFTRHPDQFTFNADEIRVPSARQLRYADKRANSTGKVPDDTWILLPKESDECFQPEQDAWLESRVCGTFKEWAGHTTQLPLALEPVMNLKSCGVPL